MGTKLALASFPNLAELQTPTPKPTPTATKKPEKSSAAKSTSQRSFFWIVLGLLIFTGVGGGIFFLVKWFNNATEDIELEPEPEPETAAESSELVSFPAGNGSSNGQDIHPQIADSEESKNGYNPFSLTVPEKSNSAAELVGPMPTEAMTVAEPTRLPKIDIVEELIRDLQGVEPTKRRQAIWDLAQRGDSRSVSPLVDLMIDSDSQQRGLILEALSQIGNRTLKPMNRALTISLQDENAEVRKNAIRDLTRIYDLISEMSQLLRYAADDPDVEVRETAKWALNQLNRIRNSSGNESFPSAQNSANPDS